MSGRNVRRFLRLWAVFLIMLWTVYLLIRVM